MVDSCLHCKFRNSAWLPRAAFQDRVLSFEDRIIYINILYQCFKQFQSVLRNQKRKFKMYLDCHEHNGYSLVVGKAQPSGNVFQLATLLLKALKIINGNSTSRFTHFANVGAGNCIIYQEIICFVN